MGNAKIGTNISLIILVGIIVVIAAVLLSMPKSAKPAPVAAFGTTTDGTYNIPYKGTTLAIGGWIVNHGRDRVRGYWYEVADFSTYSSWNGKTVKCWHKGHFKPKDGTHVFVVLTVIEAGEGTVVSTRIDEETPKKPPDMRKWR